jgi:NAD(P)-dependent dehydrogenase (short-subunit alcohol dehydrogenase family)
MDRSSRSLACRSVEKGRAAAKDIQTSTGCLPDVLDVWQLDMASYDSVQAFASRVHANLPRLDVFIANAGINSSQFQMFEKDEAMITVNVVSLFLLGFLLYPKLRETAAQYESQTYFTITASDLHEIAKFEERKASEGQIFRSLNRQSTFSGSERYATSKLMEILLVKVIAALAPLESRNVIINCVSPG